MGLGSEPTCTVIVCGAIALVEREGMGQWGEALLCVCIYMPRSTGGS